MKPIHVAATVVRLFSICLAFYSLTLLLNSWMFFVSSDTPVFSIFTVAIPIAFLLISVVLWNFPISISRTISGLSPNNDDKDLSFKSDEFLSICMFSLGLYFLYDVLGEAAFWFNYLNNYELENPQGLLNTDQKAALWSFFIRAVFTGILLVGNRRIVGLFKKLKYGG